MGLAEDTERTTEPDRGAEAVLEDISDGLEALMAVPVCILSTWGGCMYLFQHSKAE